jgi:hypothetical protein
MERTVRKVPTAPKTDHVSLRFGFLGVTMISNEAAVAIKTAKRGRTEIIVSIGSMGIKKLSFQFTDTLGFNDLKLPIDSNNDTQGDGRFRGGYTHNEQSEGLSGGRIGG